MEKFADAGCNYRIRAGRRNWARDWLRSHPDVGMAIPDRASMTEPLNAALKARAFWWMLAELAGWKAGQEAAAPAAKEQETGKAAGPARKTAGTAAATKTETATGPAPFKKMYKFDKISDYRDWKESGTDESLIPAENDGKGLIVPEGGRPGMAIHRMQFPVALLRFKAKLEKGNYINWYINCSWEGSWKPSIGIGGIIGRNGCRYIVNGQVFDIRNAPRLDDKVHTYEVRIQGKKLIWSMDGKVIFQRGIPELSAGSERRVRHRRLEQQS